MKKIRVMVIEDSLSVRVLLEHIISSDPRLELVHSTSTAEEGIAALARVAPDVISLDIRLPGMNGLEATLAIMAEHPMPIVVIADNVDSDELSISINALRAGALSVLEKPPGLGTSGYEPFALRMCDQLVAMSAVKVIRQRFARTLEFDTRKGRQAVLTPPRLVNRVWDPQQFKMLGVVASTGGPQALEKLFRALPADFPLPIVLVQHITSSFLYSFANWLGTATPFACQVAADLERPQAGRIYLSPPDLHLEVGAGGLLRVTSTPPVGLHRPSGTVLFRSMAQSLGTGGIGVLLTGMGDDGAAGLLEIRRAGGYTLTEDESTAIVYGMPGVGVRIGASCESLPLPKVGPRIIELISNEASK